MSTTTQETGAREVARTLEYAIGTQYKDRRGDICTIIDVHKTFNSAGELVKVRYVSTHTFMGQTVTNSDVIGTTIARASELIH